jgi:arylsulfatase A-like enzyme
VRSGVTTNEKAIPEPVSKILFVIIDQLRADCLHGALAEALDLPNLRALMEDGVSFRQHFTVTNPCGPARASLLTGLYAMNHRSVRNGAPLDATLDTLPRALREAGVEPLLFGYTDTSLDPRGRPADDPALKTYEGVMPGFTPLLAMESERFNPWIASLIDKGYALSSVDHAHLYQPVSPEPGRPAAITDPAIYRSEDSDTAFLTDQAISMLSLRRNESWCAHVTYIRPHPPFVAPSPYNDMYRAADLPWPAARSVIDERAMHPLIDIAFAKANPAALAVGFDLPWEGLSNQQVQDLRAVYLGLTTEVDAAIGRLIEGLKTSGQFDDTLIIVTADHGEMLGDHRMWGKESFYDPAFHIPLVIRDPRRRETAGRIVDDLTESIDLAPTLLDWLGEEAPLGFNGRSLLPFLDGESPNGWRDYVFAELDLGDPENPTLYQERLELPLSRCNLSILREKRLKYVHVNGDLPPLLFDLIDDPFETKNLADDPAYASEHMRLMRRMLDHRMTFADHKLSHLKLTEQGVVGPPLP